MNKELQKLVNEYMPSRYYGHEARRYAKVVAVLYAEQQVKKLNEPVVMQKLPSDEEIYGAMMSITAYFPDEIAAIKVCEEMNNWWKHRLSMYENKTKV